MNTVRTIYPYGLHEIVRKHDSELPVGKLLFSISRTKQQSLNNNDYLKNNTITDVFTNIDNIIESNIKDTFYKTRIVLNNLEKKILYFSILRIFYIIDNKTYEFKKITPKKSHKHVYFVKFDNKALGVI